MSAGYNGITKDSSWIQEREILNIKRKKRGQEKDSCDLY